MSLRSVVEWAPREANKEADKLANGNTEDFDPSLRIEVSASTLCWVSSRRHWKQGERQNDSHQKPENEALSRTDAGRE